MVQAMQFFRGNTDDGLANLCLEMIANPLYVDIDIQRNFLNVCHCLFVEFVLFTTVVKISGKQSNDEHSTSSKFG